MTTYYMTRLCVTGANEYRFYKEDAPVGSAVAHVLPSYPLTLPMLALSLLRLGF